MTLSFTRYWTAISTVFVVLIFSITDKATGQARSLPNANYYQAFVDYYQADYQSAGKEFARGGNGAFKIGNQRYLDSICFWTMVGECHYHLGNYADAIQMYERSLDLYLAYQSQKWQSRLQPPPNIAADNAIGQRVRITWGNPGRQATIPNLPSSFGVLFGQLDAERALQQGGVVQNAEVRKIDLTEIMRCTALALHRRRVIKGPTSKYDPFSANLINGLRGVPVGDGSLIGAYNGVLLGIAQASMDDWESAAKTLNRSLQFNGNMDHPLTAVALIELANIGIETENLEVAQRLALEASYSAAYFYQYDLIEEALAIGTQMHLINGRGAYPPLKAAIVWAKRENASLMQASLMIRLAECFAESGQPEFAAAAIRPINTVINSRNSLSKAVVASRLKYVSALIQFETGNFTNGISELTATLKSYQTGSLWLYRLVLADSLAIAGNAGERQSDLLYGALLRDPTARDWKLDPLESLTFLASSHVGPMERWFDIVVNRKDMDRAVNVAELVRRHRFFSQLPMGGRLLAFRWVLHAPEQALNETARQQRREFLAKNTQYQQWINRAEQIRTALLLLPMKPDDQTDQAREQAKLIAELSQVSELQEAFLASYALRREPAEMIFPPQFDISEFRNNIAKDQLALVSLSTNSGYHLFFVNSVSVQYLGLSQGPKIAREVAGLLKDLGVSDSHIDLETLQSTDWKETAKKLTGKLLGDIPANAWNDIRELVIVPDGLLWYLPFELLQIGDGEQQKNLADGVELRYSPTLFLAYRAQRPARSLQRTAIVSGKLHPRGAQDLSEKQFPDLLAALPSAVNFDRALRVPSNPLASLLDHLIVWSEIPMLKGFNPLDIQPISHSANPIGSTIDAWLTLPWYGPEHITLPAFHSDGGSGLRLKMYGNDLFLATTGLMASGVRTILISRWRTGGANSLALTRNYAQRLPNMAGGIAFKESVEAAKTMDLDYSNEPQLRTKSRDAVLKAEHPYFWAGLMRLEIPTEEAIGAANDEPNPAPVADENAAQPADIAPIQQPAPVDELANMPDDEQVKLPGETKLKTDDKQKK